MRTARYRFDSMPELTDPEDIDLQTALRAMQGIVDRLRGGIDIDSLSEAEQQQLVDRIRPHLVFELEHSDGIWPCMPIATGGAGGFVAATFEGDSIGGQHMSPGDYLIGTVDDVWPYPVPTLRRMIEAAENPDHVIRCGEQALSAAVVIHDAEFYEAAGSPGARIHDLGMYQIIVPAIYNMPMGVADIAD